VNPEQGRARLSLFDCIAIGINGIVGSGIFLLPGRMAAVAGPSAALAFLVCGGICILIALCFAEAAGMFDRSGGAYLYARVAFGERVGFAIGWMALVEGVIGFAAGSRGFASQLGALWPAIAGPTAQAACGAGFILLLGAINALGLKAGARTSDGLSILKLVPLVALCAAGLWVAEPARLHPLLPTSLHGFGQAVFLAIFACSGFEYVAVPAGEASQARRDVPIAIVGALAGATVLYALVQLAAMGSTDIRGSSQPIFDAAVHLLGSRGGTLVLLAALVSMAGFCASSALIGPRLFVAFADEGILPGVVKRMHPRLGTPLVAVSLAAGLSAIAAATLDFDHLVDIGNVVLFAQYLPTCLAVMVLRRTRPDLPRTYRVPFGDIIPVLAMGSAIAMLIIARPPKGELIASVVTVAVGFVLFGIRKRLTASAAK
jgi:APA family basic amino acid/polyamine antiporter